MKELATPNHEKVRQALNERDIESAKKTPRYDGKGSKTRARCDV